MKVKTFTGSETAKVDKRVNDWLAQFGIRPHDTNTAIGQFTVKAEDQRTGKPVNRRAAAAAEIDLAPRTACKLIPFESLRRFVAYYTGRQGQSGLGLDAQRKGHR